VTHGFVEILIESTAVQAMVGLNASGDTHKVYPVIIPEREKPPYICVRVTSIRPIECKGQASMEEIDSVTIDCYALSYKDAYTMYCVVRDVLDNQEFTLRDGTIICPRIKDAQDVSEIEMLQLGRRDTYCVASSYEAEVTLSELS